MPKSHGSLQVTVAKPGDRRPQFWTKIVNRSSLDAYSWICWRRMFHWGQSRRSKRLKWDGEVLKTLREWSVQPKLDGQKRAFPTYWTVKQIQTGRSFRMKVDGPLEQNSQFLARLVFAIELIAKYERIPCLNSTKPIFYCKGSNNHLLVPIQVFVNRTGRSCQIG